MGSDFRLHGHEALKVCIVLQSFAMAQRRNIVGVGRNEKHGFLIYAGLLRNSTCHVGAVMNRAKIHTDKQHGSFIVGNGNCAGKLRIKRPHQVVVAYLLSKETCIQRIP